ncbi:beta-N-acetylhexosaminidase [Nocardia jejuensis]|uniref:beta-N-acetylhexosaminidase n=1 Tax=Nocardia jejuensis TaxID=328049 RepID=UPI000830358A|nr:glycoside hydrolase family 20 protein [Nocardia jejuensis]
MRALLRAFALPVLVLLVLPAPAARATPGVGAPGDATSALPVTVPGIRRWDSGAGRFALADTVRIVASDDTAAAATRLARDLTRTGRSATVTSGTAEPGDVVLRVDGSAPEQPESYRIDIGDVVTASARTEIGVIHATQTLLQWFSHAVSLARGTESLPRDTVSLPRGTAIDWPDYPERGLMLDVGREFLTVAWVKQRIREMAYYRMNLLHLHLSDHYGFRLESTSHPEITSPEHYSRADIAEILSYAAAYGIEVVPEIGIPGHMNAILAAHPDLILRPSVTGPVDVVTDSLLAGNAEGRIDLSDPRARPLIEDLLREYVPMFPGRYFHLGGDEYVSDYSRYPQLGEYARTTLGPEFTGRDVVADLFDWAAGIVRSYGRTPRVWNDGIPRGGRIPLDRSIVVEHWTAGDGLLPWLGNGNGPEALADAGFTLSNAAFTPTYWATGGYARSLNAPPELLYAWDPGLFVNGTRLRADQRDRLLGSKLHVWCDDPTAMTEQQMVGPVRERLPIMAQQLWSGTGGVAYAEFADRVRTVGVPSP